MAYVWCNESLLGCCAAAFLSQSHFFRKLYSNGAHANNGGKEFIKEVKKWKQRKRL